jgi:hypothetical protein
LRHWFRALTSKRSLRRGHLAQGLVEYGMIVAAVAFVGMVGLQLVGRAEEAVLRGEPLASATPVPGFFLHPTTTTLSGCVGGNYIAGDSITCIATVNDTFLPAAQASPPGGNVRLRLDATQIALCATPLAPIGPHTSQCTLAPYTLQQTDAGSHGLVADYFNQTTNHNTSSSTPPLAVTIAPKIAFNFATCTNPWNGPLWNFRAAIGQPLICQLRVVDGVDGVTPWPAGQTVHLTADNIGGSVWFGCFTDYVASPSNSFAMTNDPGCMPRDYLDCTTVAGGLCAFMGQPYFEYRRTYTDAGQAPAGTDHLHALALGQPGVSGPITLGVGNLHTTGTILNCDPTNVTRRDTQDVRKNPGPIVTVTSDVNLVANGSLTVSCTASVMDLDPTTTFDYPACSNINVHACNIDDVDAFSPLGIVHFTISDLDYGTSVDVPCTLGHLSATPSPVTVSPTHLLNQPVGQIRYASWCSLVNYSFGPGNWKIVASYLTPVTPHYPSPTLGDPWDGFASLDLNIRVN